MRLLLVVATFILSVSAAHAQFFGQPTRYAVTGRPLLIYNATTTNPDCTSIGHIEVRVVQAPQHGRFVVTRKRVYPNFSRSNPRSVCNRRGAPGVEVSYISARGYTGPDSGSIEVIWPQGNMRQQSVSIMVR